MKPIHTRRSAGICQRAFIVLVTSWWSRSASGSILYEEPVYEAWSPPLEYASKTWGHKTMYLADVKIGSMAQTFRMLVDTGSWMVVVPGAVHRKLGCSRHPCFDTRNATDNHQTAAVHFAHGSLSGNIYSDRVCTRSQAMRLQEIGFLQKTTSRKRFGARSNALLQRDTSKHVPMLCVEMPVLVADRESEDFANAPFDGILGLGLRGQAAGKTSDTTNAFSFLEQLRAHGSIASAVFTLRLGNDGASKMVFGSADARGLVGGRFLWVPLSAAADGHWQLTLSDLTLNGIPQHIGPLEVIVDSGTSLLAPDDELRDWFTRKLTPASCESVNSLPWLGFSLPAGGRLTMLPSDYVDRVDGKCVLAVMPLNISTSALPASASQNRIPRLLLGDSFLRHFVTAFDMQGRRVGFGVDQFSDLAKEVATSLFPDAPPEGFNEMLPELPETGGDIDGVVVSDNNIQSQTSNGAHEGVQSQADTNESSTEPGMAVPGNKAEDHATMSAAEQAGYDFVHRLWDSTPKPNPKFLHARSNSSQISHQQRQAGNSTEDKLQEASNNLDRMLGNLKQQRTATNSSNSANISEHRISESEQPDIAPAL